LQFTSFKEQRQWIEKGKKLNPLLIENKARVIFGRKNHVKELAKQMEVTPILIYNAFKGKAPLRLFLINHFLKSLQSVDPNLSAINNKILDK
jgi:hypothetical protein